jgi:autotransporter-associated beta strand protein
MVLELIFLNRSRSRFGARLTLRSLMASTAVVSAAMVLPASPVSAADFTWNGTGISYGDPNNWNPTAGAPPVSSGQAAIFSSGGLASVFVSGSTTPDSWTFDANARSYVITGTAVSFQINGSGASIRNNANSGQTITITNNLTAGQGISQNGASTLILSGSNSLVEVDVDQGTVKAGSTGALGSGAILNLGFFTGVTATFDLGGNNITILDLGSTADGVITNSGSTNAVLNVQFGGGSGTIQDGATHTTGLTKDTTGTVTLSGNSTYSGATTVSMGTLKAGSTTGLSSASAFTVDATLDLNGFNSTIASLSGSSTGVVTNSGASPAVLTVGGTGTFAGTIQDGSSTTGLKMSGVMLTLTGTNTYSGGTTFAAGVLNLGSASAIGTGGTLSFTGGTLQYSAANQVDYSNRFSTAANQAFRIDTNGQDVTFANGLTSSGGSLTKLGTGTLTLAAISSYTGATTISGGTLALSGSGAIASSSGVNLATGSTFDISQLASGTFTGALGNTASGQTGTVSLGAATLAVNSGTNTFAGVIQDAGISGATGGNFSVVSGASQTLSGTNTYTGQTNVEQGTLALIGTGSIATSSVVGVGSGLGTTTFDISGTTAGASIKDLTGASDGIVNLGSKTLTITNASTTFAAFAGAINGSGGLSVTGGVQELSGNNGYTGVTSISSGAIIGLQGTGSIASSSKVIDNGTLDLSVTTSGASIKSLAGTNTNANLFLDGGKTLTITAANDTYAGKISGANGNLVVAGGTETLSGTSTYTGATTINGGTLNVTGALNGTTNVTVNNGGTLNVTGSVSDPTINAGALLTGSGAVGDTTINAGGTFAPGAAGTPGTSMTVNGNLALASGAAYVVFLNPSTASFANVTGTATPGGATVNAIFANGSYISKQYTILTAGHVSGTFGTLSNTNLPSNFTDQLSYDSTHAYLNLTLNFTPSTAPNFGSGLSGNQQAVANTLINFFNTTGGIPMAFGALAPAGLTQASGESATGSQQTTFNAMSQFLGVMTDPFIAGRGDPVSAGGTPTAYAAESLAYAARALGGSRSERDAYAAIYTKAPAIIPFEQRWSVWAAGFGGTQNTNGDPRVLGSNDTSSSIYGTAVGADYRFSPDTLAGFALAGGGTSFNVNGLGYGRSDLFQAGAFIRHNMGAAYISGALAYGWQDVTTDRTVTAAGIDHLRAEFNANAWSGRVEGGYRFVVPTFGGLGVTPYAAGQFTTFDLPAYAEGVVAGSPLFALSYAGKSVTDTRSELGFRTDKSYAMSNGILTLRGRLAWAHDFDPDRAIGATFQSLPGASFVVNGAAQASDSALTTASLEMKWLNGWSTALTFEGEFSNVTESYAGKGVVRYAW